MRCYLTAKQTALVLAVLLKRSGLTRARLSAATIRAASGGLRRNLRSAFIRDLRSALEDHSWGLHELDIGGYAAVSMKSLEAAKAVTLKRYLTDDERKALKRGDPDLSSFEEELSPPDDENSEDDEDAEK
jgi:hypothetical protein